MNKKIVIITNVFPPEPVVSAGLMSDLADELTKRGKNVVVLRPSPSRPKGFSFTNSGETPNLGYEVITLDSYVFPSSQFKGRFKESYSMGKAAVKYIEEHHNEIEMIYNAPWHLVGRKMVSKVAVKYGIPYVTPVQDIYPEAIISKLPKNKLLQSILMNLLLPTDVYTLGKAALVHTISDTMAGYLSETRKIPRNRFVVVRNWQDESKFIKYRNEQEQKDNTSDLFTFMYMGNVGPLAGIDFLFESFHQAQLPNSRLVIAGSGSAKEKLINLAKQKYSEEKIEFWDVPNGMVPATQAKADVMLLPVLTGGAKYSIPSKLPAYMFSAKPVLSCVDLDSDTAMCIRTSQGGWVEEPENIVKASDAMKIAYSTSKEELDKMGENGFNFAMNNLSRSHNLKILVDACMNVLNNK